MSEIAMDARMAADAATAKPRTRVRKLLRGLWRVGLVLLLAYVASRMIAKYSGSNQWELIQERNGAKVYTLKQPGTNLEQQRGVVRVRSSLSGLVAWMQGGDACKNIAGCHDGKKDDPVDEQIRYGYFRFQVPRPLRPREFYFRAHFHQIPATKEVWVEYAAIPDAQPLDDCCFRVTQMSNTWRLTPVGNGMVEAEYVMNMDWGGFLPDIVATRLRRRFMMSQLLRLQGNVDKFQHVKFGYIQEQ